MPEPIEPPNATKAPEAARRLGPPPWTWMVLACVLVAASGLVRINQERLFADAARKAEEAPFGPNSDLRELPRTVGAHWKMVGDELELEAETLAIAGCTDYMYRQYANDRTGVTLTVLVSFGPAIRVFPHSPIVCFPANGYEPRGGPWRRVVDLDEGGPGQDSAILSALAYGRDSDELREVFYTYWHDGRWDPEASSSKKYFQHRPRMFKIQVERPITPNEINAPASPIMEFVEALIPEIDRRIAESEAAPASQGLADD